MKFETLQKLAVMAAQRPSSGASCYSYEGQNYSYEEVNRVLNQELHKLSGTYRDYRENKNKIFALIEDAITQVYPQRVMDQYQGFAEVKHFAQGDKPVFYKKEGRQRAKQFVTRVGLNGRYEVFKLDRSFLEVPTSAIGGAAKYELEEFLDGHVDWAEFIAIIMDGMDELTNREIAAALNASVAQLPAANRAAVAGFNEEAMDRLLMVSGAYANNAPIYCSEEFAAKIMPAASLAAFGSGDLAKEYWENGRFQAYKRHPIIPFAQSFEDETNAKKLIDPGYQWIIPGGASKPVKIALEGSALVFEGEDEDHGREFQTYMKTGIGVMQTNDICSYIDTDLLGKMDTIPVDPEPDDDEEEEGEIVGS